MHHGHAAALYCGVVGLIEIPFRYAHCAWTLLLEAASGRIDLVRDGESVGSLRYDPDFGFGTVPPPLQPLLMLMRELLSPYDDRIRNLKRLV